MKENWRPDNWENDFGEGFAEFDAFEAGADAMYEGLLEAGVYDIIKFTDKDVIIKLKTIVENTYKQGIWVFIPDDEVRE